MEKKKGKNKVKTKEVRKTRAAWIMISKLLIMSNNLG